MLEAKIKFSASLLSRQSSRNFHAFMVGDDPRLSGVDESSQSGTSFPEGGTSLEDVVMYHVADILRKRNVHKIFIVTDRPGQNYRAEPNLRRTIESSTLKAVSKGQYSWIG